MNKQVPAAPSSESGQYRSLQILDELSNNDSLTQRDLSQRLGIALGLVNSYIKNLISKGYITVKDIPSKRYAYYLTPNGFAEKTRLAYDLLSDYTRIYREAKQGFRLLFQKLEQEGVRKVVFAGADEVAEIAYITLQETKLDLAGVVDNNRTDEQFFNLRVAPLDEVNTIVHDCIVVTSYLSQNEFVDHFTAIGYRKSGIRMVFTGEMAPRRTHSKQEIAR